MHIDGIIIPHTLIYLGDAIIVMTKETMLKLKLQVALINTTIVLLFAKRKRKLLLVATRAPIVWRYVWVALVVAMVVCTLVEPVAKSSRSSASVRAIAFIDCMSSIQGLISKATRVMLRGHPSGIPLWWV